MSHPPFAFQMCDFEKIVVCCSEMSAKDIENSHANIQSCFQEHWQQAVKNKCQVCVEQTDSSLLLSVSYSFVIFFL